jgi:hypothetical protein
MFEISWEDANGNVTLIDFDASITESYSSPATVSDHSVEDGGDISDAVIPGNDLITVEGMTTNTPIAARVFGMDGATIASRGQTIVVDGKQRSVQVWQASQPFDRVKRIDSALIALRNAKQRLTLRTSLREVSPVVIQSYDVQRDADSGTDSLPASLTFRQIRIATTQRVAVAASRQRHQQSTRNRGTQPAAANADDGTGLLPAQPDESLSHRVARSRGWIE